MSAEFEEFASPQVDKYHSWWLEDGVPKKHEFSEKLPGFFGPIEGLDDPLERLDVITIGKNPKVGYVILIHGDEDLTDFVELVKQSGQECILIPYLNPPAVAMATHGQIWPWEKGQDHADGPIVRIINNRVIKKDKKGERNGVMPNLNRMFYISDMVSSWEQIEESFPDDVEHHQLRLILAMIKDNPQIEYWVSVHGDMKLGSSYLYDTPLDESEDVNSPDHRLIQSSVLPKLRRIYKEDGLKLCNCAADRKDPRVDLRVINGYAYDPVYRNINDGRPPENTLDKFLMKLAELKLIQAKRVITLEFPLTTDPNKLKLMIKNTWETLYKYFFKAKGL